MAKMTLRDVLQTNGFKTMAVGFVLMMFGILFIALDLWTLGLGLAPLGMFIGFVGFVMHTRLVLRKLAGHK